MKKQQIKQNNFNGSHLSHNKEQNKTHNTHILLKKRNE
jgi:hypothetical protein